MTPEELRKLIADCEIEIAAKVGELSEALRTSKVTKEDADKQMAELRAKKADWEKQLAQAEMPKPAPEQRSFWKDVEDAIRKAGLEQRAITIGSNGQINQISSIFQPIDEKDGLLNMAQYYYGPNASTNIPVITTPLADPTGLAEGGSGSDDTTAAMGTTEIQPKNHMAILPLTAEALTLNSASIESILPDLFNKAFRKLMRKGMLTGNGQDKNMKGIFASVDTTKNVVETASTSGIKVTELAELAVEVAGYDEPFTLVMSPSVYAKILADTSTDETTKIYKEEIIKSKSIEGVPIKLEQNAPQWAATAGTIPVCAAPLGRYAIGIADSLTIDPIKIKGDSRTYFQATMFFSGKQTLESDCHGIMLKAA